MTDTFDAVLADLKYILGDKHMARLAAAHAAEVGHQSRCAQEWFYRFQKAEARAEAAERDAMRYRWLRENCGYSGSGPHTGAQVIVYYADVGNGKHGIAYTGPKQRVGIMAIDAAIDAAMATTEQADPNQQENDNVR